MVQESGVCGQQPFEIALKGCRSIRSKGGCAVPCGTEVGCELLSDGYKPPVNRVEWFTPLCLPYPDLALVHHPHPLTSLPSYVNLLTVIG